MRIPRSIILPLLLFAAPAAAADAPPAAPDQPKAASGQAPDAATKPAAAQPAATQPAAPAQPQAAAAATAGTAAVPPADTARIDAVSGNVAIYQLGQTDWTRADADLPLATGAWLATDPKGRAELRLGDDSLALAGNTEVNFVNLHGQALQVAVAYGRVEFRLHQAARGKSEIDVPGGAVWLNEPGVYDISVGAQGRPSRVAVLDGTARFTGGGLDQTIEPGNALVVQKAGANLTASVARAVPDEFSRWARARDAARDVARNADRREIATRSEPAPAAAAAAPDQNGTSQPQATAPSESAAEPERLGPAPRAERREEHRGREVRIERRRHFHHRRYARYYRRRVYRGGYYAAPALPNPLGVLHSLVPFLP